jgi:hypothetical protein
MRNSMKTIKHIGILLGMLFVASQLMGCQSDIPENNAPPQVTKSTGEKPTLSGVPKAAPGAPASHPNGMADAMNSPQVPESVKAQLRGMQQSGGGGRPMGR